MASNTISLFRVLWAHLGRSRNDALNYARAELRNDTRTARARIRESEILQRAGGSAAMLEAEYARLSPTMARVIRQSAAIPVHVLRRAPNAEECYMLMQRGFRVAHLRPAPPPKKSALWMQIVAPAGTAP